MKSDQAATLIEMTASKCSSVKYDVELAEEYIARQVRWRSDLEGYNTRLTCGTPVMRAA